jgi:hypothetical protein
MNSHIHIKELLEAPTANHSLLVVLEDAQSTGDVIVDVAIRRKCLVFFESLLPQRNVCHIHSSGVNADSGSHALYQLMCIGLVEELTCVPEDGLHQVNI